MIARTESAAATKRALLRAAATLLDEGGPEAVTLRAVGARAGVSRGAPYGHFSTKEDLLTALATEQWSRTSEQLAALRADERLPPRERLRRALAAWLDIARRRPHLYALMFATPSRNPEPLLAAASDSQDEFLAIVAAVVGTDGAGRTAALLLSTTHGIATLEQAGQFDTEKWGTNGDELVQAIVDQISR